MSQPLQTEDSAFPYSLVISVPLPSHRLAASALRALQVDRELSPLVKRTFRLAGPPSASAASQRGIRAPPALGEGQEEQQALDVDGAVGDAHMTVLETEYRATTNRMLRVAVNAFMDSLGVVVEVMEELDVDVLSAELGRQAC